MRDMNEMMNTNNTLTIQFRSTSTLPSSGSAYSSNPQLGEDGVATYTTSSYSPASGTNGHIRKNTGTPDFPKPGDQQPLGDVLFPLLLLAFAYAMIKLLRIRRKKSALTV